LIKIARRLPLALTAIAAVVLSLPSPAEAATNSPKPTLANWGVFQSCGGKNCGEIRATAQRGSTIYAVGNFSKAIGPTGGASLPYQNLVALNGTSGAVNRGFAHHSFNGEIYAVAVDSAADLLYVGGSFTAVDGSRTGAAHVAAFNATTGKRDTGFRATVNGTVRALLFDGGHNSLFVGGRFTAVNGVSRVRLAAVDPHSGAVKPSFGAGAITWSATSQTATTGVYTLALAGSDLYVGGHFDHVAGSRHLAVARVNAGTGKLDDGFSPTLDSPAADNLLIVEKIISVPGGIVVAQGGHVNRAYRFTGSGRRVWTQRPNGDVQAAARSGSSVYLGGHFTCDSTGSGSCQKGKPGAATRVHLVAVNLTTGAIDPAFAPAMAPSVKPYFYGVWSLMVDSRGALWAGGAFTKVVSGGHTYPRPKLAVFGRS
jgi:hypothetical protein